MKVKYYIDGVDFEQYGIYVSASSGIMGALPMKDRVEVSWPDSNGKIVDLSAPRFEAREIKLECVIVSTNDLLYSKVNDFFQQLLSKGLHQLLIQIGDLVVPYMVYLPNAADIDKRWKEGQVVGTFTLGLVEPEPVKKILRFTGTTQATITLSSASPVNIHWGDKQSNTDILGSNITANHTYETAGNHYIVITGVIDDITNFSTNATVLWSKLQ